MFWDNWMSVSLNAMVNVKHFMEIFATSMVVNMLLIPDVTMAMLTVAMLIVAMLIMMIPVVFIVCFNVEAMVHWLVELMVFV